MPFEGVFGFGDIGGLWVLGALPLGVPTSELLLAKLLLFFFPLGGFFSFFFLPKTLINEPDFTCGFSSDSGEELCPLVTCVDVVTAAADAV